jgi:uncharacterized protein
MSARDSRFLTRFIQPASFRFWAIASAAVACLGVLGLFVPVDSGETQTGADDGPNVVINLQKADEGAASAATPSPDAHGAQTPPQSVDVTNALVAADGTVVIDPALLAPGPDGPLPVVAQDGRKPMHVYAAKFDLADTRPRVAVILTGLGLSAQTTQMAIDRLPPGSTLSFSPYGQDLQNWIATARAKGHEVLLELPMEPFDFPNDDPGTHTLIAGATDNAAKLNWLLARFSGYAGVVNVQGGKFLASSNDLQPVLAQIAQRGLYLAEVGLSQRSVAGDLAKTTLAPYTKASITIDKVPSADDIDAALEGLTALALERRGAIGAAAAAPGVIERVAAWSAKLEDRGVAFSPVSAVLPVAVSFGP